MRRSCQGCVQNTQRIQILENRIKYLEQNMMTRSSTPFRRPRSRSRRSRSRSKTDNTNKQQKYNDKKMPGIGKEKEKENANKKGASSQAKKDVEYIENGMSHLRVSRLPEYYPEPPIFSGLNPIAHEFQPRDYFAYNQPAPNGGASGYQ